MNILVPKSERIGFGSVSDRICTPLMLTKPCPQIVNLVEKSASACFLISSHILGTVKGGAKRVDGCGCWNTPSRQVVGTLSNPSLSDAD
jgi:hypothetical protein